MEVCFMTSAGNSTNNRQKPRKKADKVYGFFSIVDLSPSFLFLRRLLFFLSNL